MRLMAIEANYLCQNTSKCHPQHAVFSYLLTGLVIDRPNQVWAADITYIQMDCGFMYLFAVMDWHSRWVLAWGISNTFSADFCIEAVRRPLPSTAGEKCSTPIRDRSSRTTPSLACLAATASALDKDGMGCRCDNVFVERLWRSVKDEEVYRHAYQSVAEAKAGISRYIEIYNSGCSHADLDRRAPDYIYFKSLEPLSLEVAA
jgi:putative transposase